MNPTLPFRKRPTQDSSSDMITSQDTTHSSDLCKNNQDNSNSPPPSHTISSEMEKENSNNTITVNKEGTTKVEDSCSFPTRTIPQYLNSTCGNSNTPNTSPYFHTTNIPIFYSTTPSISTTTTEHPHTINTIRRPSFEGFNPMPSSSNFHHHHTPINYSDGCTIRTPTSHQFYTTTAATNGFPVQYSTNPTTGIYRITSEEQILVPVTTKTCPSQSLISNTGSHPQWCPVMPTTRRQPASPASIASSSSSSSRSNQQHLQIVCQESLQLNEKKRSISPAVYENQVPEKKMKSDVGGINTIGNAGSTNWSKETLKGKKTIVARFQCPNNCEIQGTPIVYLDSTTHSVKISGVTLVYNPPPFSKLEKTVVMRGEEGSIEIRVPLGE